MSGGVNRVILVGNLGADPELKTTRAGHPAARMRIATSRSWRDAQGERKEEAEWHTIKIYGPQAETCHRYLTKGRKILVEGRIHYYSWEDDAKQTRWGTEIIAEHVDFLDARDRHDNQQPGPASNTLEFTAPPAAR